MTNNQMIQKFRELWGNYPRTKNENSLGLDYLVEQLLLSSLQEQAKAIINELESNPNDDGSISPNLQHFIEKKQLQLRNKFINH